MTVRSLFCQRRWDGLADGADVCARCGAPWQMHRPPIAALILPDECPECLAGLEPDDPPHWPGCVADLRRDRDDRCPACDLTAGLHATGCRGGETP